VRHCRQPESKGRVLKFSAALPENDRPKQAVRKAYYFFDFFFALFFFTAFFAFLAMVDRPSLRVALSSENLFSRMHSEIIGQ
jgi:hypothetical protein